MCIYVCDDVLGYNHPAIAASLREEGALLSLVNRPALSAFPPVDLAERISNSLLKVAPRGLNKVCTLMCGTCSNENAFKAAFIRYMVSWFVAPFTNFIFLYIEQEARRPPRSIRPEICRHHHEQGDIASVASLLPVLLILVVGVAYPSCQCCLS